MNVWQIVALVLILLGILGLLAVIPLDVVLSWVFIIVGIVILVAKPWRRTTTRV